MNPTRGIVVSAHPTASKAGAAVLKKGGNAVDAAVATSLMLGVAEPAYSGIGGGGFALVRMSSGKSVALDYRETAPSRASPSMFGDGSDKNRIGPLAVATPGMVAGHMKLLEEYGTMKFEDLAKPAIEAAKSGVGESLSQRMLKKKDAPPYQKVSRFKPTVEAFVGKRRYPALGKTLSAVSMKGKGEFYTGQVAKEISNYVEGLGGILSTEDFASYSPRERKPIEADCLGLHLLTMPPPSAGGTLLAQGLLVMEELQKRGELDDRADRPLRSAAVMAFFLGQKHLFGDPDFVPVPSDSMTSEMTVSGVADEVESGNTGLGEELAQGPGSTSHFSVVDRMGNVVSATETVECYYGSGVTVPSLGLIMNDEMHDFDVQAGNANSVAPWKRPASSMTPTIVLKDGEPFMVLGGAGSERIITSVFQTVMNATVWGMPLDQAISSPRVHPSDGRLEVESGTAAASISRLRKSGFGPHLRPRKDPYFGGVHAVMVDPKSGKVHGGADPRRLGAAALD